jgi:heat shock protein HslJ
MYKEIRFRGIVLLSVLVASVILSSCGLLPGSKSGLDATKWQLQTMAGNPPPEAVVITAEFNDGRISGSSGCNSYGAAYTIQDDKISLEAIAMTEMACLDEGVMESEAQFLELLGKAKSFQLNEDTLNLMDEAGNTTLTFVKNNA